MSYELDYDPDGRREWVYVKEEPDCGFCYDERIVTLDADDQLVSELDRAQHREPFRREGCPMCNPSEAMKAKFVAADRAHLDWLESRGAEEAIF